MKVGIVVPYSWSYWGGVVDHAEEQARALEQLGIEARLIIGHDPPGAFSRTLHPRTGRSGALPEHVIPVGRSVIAPANDSLANVVLSPSAIPRLKRVLAAERFDLLHIHEPLTPIIGVAALAFARVPIVATFHAAGSSRWRAIAVASWGFLLERIDLRIAVSDAAARASCAYAPGDYHVVPNGVQLPETIAIGERDNSVVFVGRHEARKGLDVLLAAWPDVHLATGARLRVIGADPSMVRLLMARQRLADTGVDLLGPLPSEALDSELARAKVLVAPSLGGESFGMVLTRAFAAGTPVVASDIDGYRDVVEPGTGELVAPGDPKLLGQAIVALMADEQRRLRMARCARVVAETKYAWTHVANELVQMYHSLAEAAHRVVTLGDDPHPVPEKRSAAGVSSDPELVNAP